MSTVASVLTVGIMMLIAGVAEVINAQSVEVVEQILSIDSYRRSLYPRGRRHLRNPVLASLLLTFMLERPSSLRA